MNRDDLVCPRCGSTAAGERFCTECGLDLANQYQLPRRSEWERRQEAEGSPAPPTPPPSEPMTSLAGASPAEPTRPRVAATSRDRAGYRGVALAGLITAATAATVFLAATFLPWLAIDTSYFDYEGTATFWELSDAADILIAIFGATLAGLVLATALMGRRAAFTAGLLASAAAFAGFGLYQAVEFLAVGANDILPSGEYEPRVGAGLGAGAGAVAIGAMVLTGLADILDESADRPHRTLITRIGLILLAVAGALAPVWLFIPTEDLSQWETNVVSDILVTLSGVGLVALALVALLRAHPASISMAASALGIVLGSYCLIISVDGLASDASAPAFVGLLVLAPLCIAGFVLVAIGAHPRPEGVTSSDPRSHADSSA